MLCSSTGIASVPLPLCRPLQATHTGFAYVNQDNVFRVCDQPHPLIVDQIVRQCSEGRLEEAYEGMRGLCDMGFSPQVCAAVTWCGVTSSCGAAVYDMHLVVVRPMSGITTMY